MAKTPTRRAVTAAPTKRAVTAKTSVADPALVTENTEGDKIELDKMAKPEVSEELVTTIVPKDFTLTRDNGEPVTYRAGIHEMPLRDAAHWWAKACGVKEYDPTTHATKG